MDSLMRLGDKYTSHGNVLDCRDLKTCGTVYYGENVLPLTLAGNRVNVWDYMNSEILKNVGFVTELSVYSPGAAGSIIINIDNYVIALVSGVFYDSHIDVYKAYPFLFEIYNGTAANIRWAAKITYLDIDTYKAAHEDDYAAALKEQRDKGLPIIGQSITHEEG